MISITYSTSMQETINHCKNFTWCNLEGLLLTLNVIRFFIIFTVKLDSFFFVYVFIKTLFSMYYHWIDRRVKTWNFIIKIDLFLSCEIVFSFIHFCELFEEFRKLVIQLRFVIFNTLLHNSTLCETILNSRFWNVFPRGCYPCDSLGNVKVFSNIRCTTIVWNPWNYMT